MKKVVVFDVNKSLSEVSNRMRASHPKVPTTNQTKYGCVNNADYVVRPVSGEFAGRMCPAYAAWADMTYRALSQGRAAHYRDVSLCPEWRVFMTFRAWWVENQVDGWFLDKDLLSKGTKIYSADTCLYLPRAVNNFIPDMSGGRGLPRGVYVNKGSTRFESKCMCPHTGEYHYLGMFDTLAGANTAWAERKTSHLLEMEPSLESIKAGLTDLLYSKIWGYVEGYNSEENSNL